MTRTLTALALLLLVGCTTHGRIGALPEVPTNDAAEIVVIREARFMGAASTSPVTLDGVDVYGLRVGEHAIMLVAPGEHIVGTHYQQAFTFSREDVTATIRAEPRGRYYFRVAPGFGGTTINAIPAQMGQRLMAETTLAR